MLICHPFVLQFMRIKKGKLLTKKYCLWLIFVCCFHAVIIINRSVDRNFWGGLQKMFYVDVPARLLFSYFHSHLLHIPILQKESTQFCPNLLLFMTICSKCTQLGILGTFGYENPPITTKIYEKSLQKAGTCTYKYHANTSKEIFNHISLIWEPPPVYESGKVDGIFWT